MLIEELASLNLKQFYEYIQKIYKDALDSYNEEVIKAIRENLNLLTIDCQKCDKKVLIVGSPFMASVKCKCGTWYAWQKYGRIDEGTEDFELYTPEIKDKTGSMLVIDKKKKGGSSSSSSRSFWGKDDDDDDDDDDFDLDSLFGDDDDDD